MNAHTRAAHAAPRRHRRHVGRVTAMGLAGLLAAASVFGAALAANADEIDEAPVVAERALVVEETHVQAGDAQSYVDTKNPQTYFEIDGRTAMADGADALGVTIRTVDDQGRAVSGLAQKLELSFQPWDGIKSGPVEEDQRIPGLYHAWLVSYERGAYSMEVRLEDGTGMRFLDSWGRNPVAHFDGSMVFYEFSHAETIGHTVPLGTDHTVLVRLRDQHNNHLRNLEGGIRISYLDDATGLSSTSFVEEWLDDEFVYVAKLSSKRVGQSIISVSFEGKELQGTPVPVWWHKAPPSAKNSKLSVSKTEAKAAVEIVDVEVKVFDEDGLPVEDPADVSVSSSFGVITETELVRPGLFSATLTSADAGVATVSFRVDDVPGTQTEQVTFYADEDVAGETGGTESTTSATDGERASDDVVGEARVQDLALTGSEPSVWLWLGTAAGTLVLGWMLLLARRRTA